MENRIKDLRKNRGLTQAGLGEIIGISQESISRYETEIVTMPVDILIKLAAFFNVTTDYLLGLTKIKRSWELQMSVNQTIDEYYDLVMTYKILDERDQELIWTIIEKMGGLRKKRE